MSAGYEWTSRERRLICETNDYRTRDDPASADAEDVAEVQRGVEIGISVGSHRVFYRKATEDVVWRLRTEEEWQALHGRADVRHEERIGCSLFRGGM